MVEIIKSVEAGKVCVILMDLTRAFNCIPYTLKLGNCRSEWEYVYKGSAQGSLLSLIIFSPMICCLNWTMMLIFTIMLTTIFLFVCSGYDYENYSAIYDL